MTTFNQQMLAATAESLADDVSITQDDLVKFIVDLDAHVGSWDFTARLVEHFEGLGKVHAIEKSLDRAGSALPEITEDQVTRRMRSS